jgi:hypothetical protein
MSLSFRDESEPGSMFPPIAPDIVPASNAFGDIDIYEVKLIFDR